MEELIGILLKNNNRYISAKVGIPDQNDIIWDTYWIPFEYLQPISKKD